MSWLDLPTTWTVRRIEQPNDMLCLSKQRNAVFIYFWLIYKMLIKAKWYICWFIIFFFVHSKVERNNSFFKKTLFLSTRWLQQIYNWNLFFFSHQEDMENADEKNGDPPMLFVLSIFFTSILHLISSFLLCFLVLSLKFLTRQVSRLISLTRERGLFMS